jgi:hypothetical protein
MKDRLSVHIENGQSDVREAVTVLRNGGTPTQSGLVGITNAAYDPDTGSPYIPETIFNIQSTGDSNVRFSSGPSKDYRSSLELLGVGNTRASGLHFSYDPQFDDSYIDADTGYGTYEPCVNPNGTDKTVADFSLIRPSGTEGMEFSHISLSERGYVSIGLTRVHEQRHFEANAPLTIAYVCDGHQDSGTISIHQQASEPTTHTNFGKVYVKPYSVGGRSQALYFKDDSGFETNLVLSQDLDPTTSTDGLIYGDTFGNTYGGWYTPSVRTGTLELQTNTFYGYGAGASIGLGSLSTRSTLIGYHAGSGLSESNRNTVVGHESLYNYSTVTDGVIIGPGNLNNTSEDVNGDPIEDIILIGTDLFVNDVPDTGVLAIGQGSNPLVLGNIRSNKHFSVNDAYFSVLDQNSTEFKISSSFDSVFSRHTFSVDIIDYNENGSDYGNDNLKFNFVNEDGLSNTLFQLDPRGGPLTNTPTYQAPASTTPYAQLDADFKLRGAIRFQDGTSLSGIADFEILPTFGTSGINKSLDVSSSTNYFVLDYSSLALAGSVSSDIQSDNTYVAVQLDGSSSSNIGKLSLQGLSNYISSGNSSIAENCNVLITNSENQSEVNTSANSRTVMIGCDVAYGVSGQLNSVIIGSDAGSNSTVSNPSLATPFNNVWIGPYAGAESNDTSYSICIGANAGRDSDDAQETVFIGNSAGQYSSLSRSIGIGKNALRGELSESEGGVGNIEIVAGIDDSQRMFYDAANLALSNRIAINNTIAGRLDNRNISIGDARLSPTAPLEVRRDTVIHGDNGNDYIQAWYCDDVLVAHIDCDGSFTTTSSTERIEGFINGTELQSSATMGVPTSGKLSVYVDGAATGTEYWITNRDSNLTISNGTYVIATLMGTEYRPIWVSC